MIIILGFGLYGFSVIYMGLDRNVISSMADKLKFILFNTYEKN